jgi:Na+/proline symporter
VHVIDWIIVGLYLVITLWIGWSAGRKQTEDSQQFFLSGRQVPWWLLGVSMVATTFSADTPNLVTDLVRRFGVAGNWMWWCFLPTAMLTVFVYARLWRSTGLSTDLAFYELRYSGKPAAFLRGFRALYLGVFFNVVIMATVSLAAIKMGAVLIGLEPWQTVIIASSVTLLYSFWGGFRSVLYTDVFQFVCAMIGSTAAAWYLVYKATDNNPSMLWSHVAVAERMDFLPPLEDGMLWTTLLLVPMLVQWWSAWYPGAEPGGGGYVVQRMLAAKSPKHAQKATLFFVIAHYAIRPWPWILVALASLVVFPDLASLQKAFPSLPPDQVANDMAYPAMISLLPVGLLGLLVASLLAAFMSTLSTHLNWGASYMVFDVYLRFLHPKASNKQQVWVGRLTTLLLMVCAAVLSLFLHSALQAFSLLLQLGAGTGLLYFLRWFWPRINAYTEIGAMLLSLLVALFLELVLPAVGYTIGSDVVRLLVGVAVTTLGWLFIAGITRPEPKIVWEQFCQAAFQGRATVPKSALISAFSGMIGIYSILTSIGTLLYGQYSVALVSLAIFVFSLLAVRKFSAASLSAE